jgi:glycosyltransferase involved in cell wall biosynthesis
VSLLGTGSGEHVDVESLSADVLSHLAAGLRLDVALYLGYRDQFPVLSAGVPVVRSFLWAQVSAVPMGPPPGATAVPLTEMTGNMLRAAGWQVLEPIPHAVDTELFAPASSPPAKAERASDTPTPHIRYLTVGANTRRKRFDLLLDAFRRLRSDRAACTLTIKTDRPKADGGFDLLGRAEPGVTVDSSERTPRAMAELYQRHDVYVHAAEWEGFGIPVAEAMACGLPVVCPAGQGPGELVPYPDLLVDTKAGPPDAPESVRWVTVPSLAEKMLLAAEDLRLRRRLGEAGRRTAVRRFDAPVVAERWLTIFG